MKKLYVVLAMLLLLCVLSSCSGNKFVYDGNITWDTTSADIIKKYGTPSSSQEAELEENHTGTVLVYENVSCFGYDGFTRMFGFLDTNKQLVLISEGVKAEPVVAKVYAEEIFNVLKKKYGETSAFYEIEKNWSNGSCYWNTDMVSIQMVWNNEMVSVMYAKPE